MSEPFFVGDLTANKQGSVVKIIWTKADHPQFPVIGLVRLNGQEQPERYTREGRWSAKLTEHGTPEETSFDLIIPRRIKE